MKKNNRSSSTHHPINSSTRQPINSSTPQLVNSSTPQPALTIAGFDPSSGAGITSDIKTMEAHSVYGLGVCTGVTVQNDVKFEYVSWIEKSIIIQQIDVLFERFEIDYVKIGLVENLQTIGEIIFHLKQKNNQIRIIWDPILKASAGFEFHRKLDINLLEKICKNIYLITPNTNEFERLFGNKNPQNIVRKYTCNLLLKGGHTEGDTVIDTLFTNHKIHHTKQLRSKRDKHGTGCVLSTTILTKLTQGKSLPDACREAQDYIVRFINSNDSHLGHHNY